MRNITEKYYAKHIPKCCRLKTVKEHKEFLMLCWGLVKDLENGIKVRKCGKECEFHLDHDPLLLLKRLRTARSEEAD